MADEGVKAVAPLNDIKNSITTIGKAARDAAEQARNVGYNLQWDPKNVTLINDRMSALNTQLVEAAKATETYKQKQAEAQAVIDEITASVGEEGKLTKEQETAVKEAEAAVRAWSNAEKSLQTNVEKINAELKGRDKQLENIAEGEKKVSENTKKVREEAKQLIATKFANFFNGLTTAITLAVASLLNMAKSAVNAGRELYNLSIRYNTSAEDIQIWNRTLELATGQNDLYTSSLKRIVAGMAEIEAHRGVNYRAALSNIGLNYTDIAGLSTAEQFEAIIDKFSEMTDATARLSAARTLLGDEGVAIAQMFEQEGFDLEALKAEAEEYGIVTQANAEKLAQMSFELAKANSNMEVAKSEIAIALTPALELMATIMTALADDIKAVADWLGKMSKSGQQTIIWIGVFLIIGVRLITWVISFRKNLAEMRVALAKVKKQADDTKRSLDLLGSSGGLLSALGGPAGLIARIAAIGVGFAGMAIAANEAKKSTEELNSALQDLEGAGEDFGANVESVTTSMSERSINVNVDIYGHGDTDISDEAAINVSQLTMDQIQKGLGDLIK